MPATSVTGGGITAPYTYKGGSYPGTGGTCGGTINVATPCTIVVTFTPTATGVANDTINIGYNNGASVTSSTRAVTGTGANPATLSISDGPTYNYGTHAVTTSTDYTFTVTYGGGVPATSVGGSGLSAPFSFKGGSYPGTGGTCGTTISANCTIVVTYAPTASVSGPARPSRAATARSSAASTSRAHATVWGKTRPATVSKGSPATRSMNGSARRQS